MDNNLHNIILLLYYIYNYILSFSFVSTRTVFYYIFISWNIIICAIMFSKKKSAIIFSFFKYILI